MGSLEDEGFGEWDAVAEEELRSIEAAYYKRRRSSSLAEEDPEGPRSSNRRSRCRRLPGWGRSDASQSICTASGNSLPNGLRGLAPSPCRVNWKVRYPAMNFSGRIVYSRTVAEVEQASLELMDKISSMKKISSQVSLGFDIEWKPVFQQGEAPTKAAVMQICMDTTHCYIMHIIHSGIPPVLKSLLEDPLPVKVGMCIANDAWKMAKDYSVCVEPLEDLSALANLKLGVPPKKWSLSSLTEAITCKQLEKPKKIRLGNWESDTLSREQLKYAATDAFVSWYLYQILKSFPDAKVETQIAENPSSSNAREIVNHANIVLP